MAISVPIISSFDGRGISKAIKDFKRLEGAGNKMQFALLNSNAAVNKGIAQFAKFGAIGAGVAGVIGSKLVQAAYESQKVMKQTEAIITATGGAAGLTASQVSDLSEKLSLQTGIDDELIQSSMNLLLTFKQVQDQAGEGNDIFTRASQAALDLGNVFGSTDAAAKMLGKALSDPTKGVSALARAGVNFSKEQKAQIKTLVDSGNVLGAQKLILAEVESQVGGTARATATAFDLMKVAIGNVAEDLGGLLLPFVERFATFVTNVLVPKMSEFADIVGEQGLGAGFRFLGKEILNVIPQLGLFADAILAIGTAYVILRGVVLAATIAQRLFNVALFANPVGITIAAIIGFIAILGALMIRFKGVREVVTTVFNIMLQGVEFFVNRAISYINMFIRAYNLIPFLDNVKTLDHISLSFGKVGKAAQASAADFRKFEEAQKKLKIQPAKTGGGLTPTTTTSTKGAASATDKAKTALDKYTSALKLFGSETKQFNDAVKGVTRSQLNLANATDDVRVAQEKFNKISKGYGAGSKEAAVATRDLADANRSAVRATMSLRDATRSVADAQKEYDDLVSGKGIATAKEELSIADDRVAAARQALADAKSQYRSYDDQADATDVLNEALDDQREAQRRVAEEQDKVNPQAIADAQQKITDAVIDQEDAQIALADANQDVLDKQKELDEVVNGAAVDSEKYKDAQKALTDAQKAEREATDELTEAYERQAEAARELKIARDALAVAAKGTTSAQERQAQEALGIKDPNEDDGGSNGFSGGMMVLPSIDFSGIDFSGIDFSAMDFSNIDLSTVPMMANGGVVNKPTLAMIGET
jgi:hypothetical protein